MGRPRVFVTRRIPEVGLNLLRAECEVTIWEGEEPPPRDALLAAAREADGLLTLLTDRVDAALLDAAPQLRVVSNMAVGYDNIDVAAATARGVLVGNTPGTLTETTADLAFALLLSVARRVSEAVDYARAGHWQTWGPLLLLGADIHHATLGVIGLGRIGLEVAKRARGFDMRVLYTGLTRRPEAEAAVGASYVTLDDLLASSDFVSIHAPLTPQTRGLLNGARLRQMRPTAYLVNTARGPIVETGALLDALRNGWIAGAALDVTDPEPLPVGHPLYQEPRCVITPHIASATVATRDQMATLAARNLLAGLRGEALPSGLNPEAAGARRAGPGAG